MGASAPGRPAAWTRDHVTQGPLFRGALYCNQWTPPFQNVTCGKRYFQEQDTDPEPQFSVSHHGDRGLISSNSDQSSNFGSDCIDMLAESLVLSDCLQIATKSGQGKVASGPLWLRRRYVTLLNEYLIETAIKLPNRCQSNVRSTVNRTRSVAVVVKAEIKCSPQSVRGFEW